MGSSDSPWGNKFLSPIIILSVIKGEPPSSAECPALPEQGEALSPGWSDMFVHHTGNMTIRRGPGLEEQWTVQILINFGTHVYACVHVCMSVQVFV